MSSTITIAPVSRLEGHGKVTLQLDAGGQVESAHFHVVEFRGFEKFCEGRLASEMPVITPRICGICPVSHHLAAVKACDDVFGVELPPAAAKLRELMHHAQTIHSHALHFFYLAAPDYLLGPDSDPSARNVVGLVQADPELAVKAIRLRKVGQELVRRVGGRGIHPVTAIPGGMSKPLSHEDRYEASRDLAEAMPLARLAIDLWKQLADRHGEFIGTFGTSPSSYMSLVKGDTMDLYDGDVRVIDSGGQTVTEFAPREYANHLSERVEPWTYLKFPYLTHLGYPAGTYRVGPLARLNVAQRLTTPEADAELREFKQLGAGGLVHSTLHYHYARVIELLHSVERARELIADDDIVSREVRVQAIRCAGEGVGIIEAPRGTLIHHYWVDDMGKLERANLIVGTIHNNPALDATVGEVARHYVHDGQPTEGALNRIEMAVRCYDPCLSCATHAVGQMPMVVEVVDVAGQVINTVQRGS